MSETPQTIDNVVEGTASALAVDPGPNPQEEGQSFRPGPRLGPSTIAGRAKAELAEIAKAAGVAARIIEERSADMPHFEFGTRAISIHSRITVHRQKFQVQKRMAEARDFSALDPSGKTMPVLFHKRPKKGIMAVMDVADFFEILRLADERAHQMLAETDPE